MPFNKDKKIYLKNIGKAGDYEVWLVDGSYVRKVINENFVEYDYHFNHSFVPKNEFWIDEQTNHNEWRFFIDRMSTEQDLIKAGESNKEASEKGALLENKERKSELRKRHSAGKMIKNKSDLLTKIKKKVLIERDGKTTIWLVDGKSVRDFYLVDYAEGGHDKVYDFIPNGEIWIDEILHPDEIKFIILHELSERRLMSEGFKYSEAHKRATLIEDYYRDHKAETEEKIEDEINKQK